MTTTEKPKEHENADNGKNSEKRMFYKWLRLSFSSALVVVIIVLILSRPERPDIVVYAYNPAKPEQIQKKQAFSNRLNELSIAQGKKQFLLYVEVTDEGEITLLFSEGPRELDEKGKGLLNNQVDVFAPAGLDVAKQMLDRELLADAVWVVSSTEENRIEWHNLLDDAPLDSWVDNSVIELEDVRSGISAKRGDIATWALFDQTGELTAPEGWRKVPESLPSVQYPLAVVVLVESVFSRKAIEGTKGEVLLIKVSGDSTDFDVGIAKDTASMQGEMARLVLDNGLRAKRTSIEPEFTITGL